LLVSPSLDATISRKPDSKTTSMLTGTGTGTGAVSLVRIGSGNQNSRIRTALRLMCIILSLL